MRDEVRNRMSEQRIGTEIYYPLSLHQQECFEHLGDPTVDLANAELAAKETIDPELTEAQKTHVVETLVSALG